MDFTIFECGCRWVGAREGETIVPQVRTVAGEPVTATSPADRQHIADAGRGTDILLSGLAAHHSGTASRRMSSSRFALQSP